MLQLHPAQCARLVAMFLPGKLKSSSSLLVACLICSLVLSPAYADSRPSQTIATKQSVIQALVDKWLSNAELSHSLIGIEITDAKDSKVIFSHNGDRRFVPASSAKILTCAAAYETLGQDYRYSTKLYAVGSIKGNILFGDIVIEPSQDPTLSRADLFNLCLVARKKIKSITGQVRIAAIPGGNEHFMPGWLNEDWGQMWMPPSSNLVIDKNIANGLIPLKGIRTNILNSASTTDSRNKSILDSDLQSSWLSLDPQKKILNLHLGQGMGVKNPIVVGTPDAYNLALATKLVHDSGISTGINPLNALSGLSPSVGYSKPNPKQTNEPKTLIAEHKSKPLSQIISHALHESDNLYTQQLLRTLGMTIGRTAASQNNNITLEKRGLAYLLDYLNKKGVQGQEVVLFDACGLSRKNCLSPHALNQLLIAMDNQPATKGYIDLLKKSSYEGNDSVIYCYKTGAMDSVRSITGLLRKGNDNIAITIMVNGHTPHVGRLRALINDLVRQIGQVYF